MADTARSIIVDALREIKVYSPNVELNAADGAQGLTCLNEMLDEWSNESLSCFANVEQTLPLVPGKQQYTIGTTGGADINAARPISILTGRGAAYLVDDNNNRYPVNVIEQDQWNCIGLLTNTSNLPDTLFYNPQFPLGVLNVFPMPNTSYNIYFDSRLQLANLANLDAAFSLPPGYRAAIKHNLAVRLWPYYKQGDPPTIVVGLAMKSHGTIKRSNLKQSPADYDAAIVSHASSTYDIYNDGATNGRNS